MTETQRKKIMWYLKFILPTLENNEIEKGYLWVNNPNNDFSKQIYFNTYEEGVELVAKYQHNNCYVGLATTMIGAYKTETLISRNVIVVDIDEENLDISDIYNKCKSIGLYSHLVVNSGRGWHLYFKLDNNYSIRDIIEVNRYVSELFNADMRACSSTQIIRVPYTKNFKIKGYSSIVSANNPIKAYALERLKNHKIIELKTGDTELEYNNIEDLYCFSQIVNYGTSKGFRNDALVFISSVCKYCNISENRALQYAYTFNDNCKEPQGKNEIKRVVRSIYDNLTTIKPCSLPLGKKLCSNQCKAKVITSKDIIVLSDINLDNKIFTLTKSHIIKYQKNNKGEKKHMLEILTGTELTIMALLKVCNTKLFTKEDISEFLDISKPTTTKALKSLKEKNIIFSTKQRIDKAKKPTELYSYNFEFEKYNKEMVHLNTNLFTAKIQKIIKDNDLKVAIALRYLISSRQMTTLEDISFLTGISENNVSRSLKSLKDNKLIMVDKIKTQKGICNSYQLFY